MGGVAVVVAENRKVVAEIVVGEVSERFGKEDSRVEADQQN